MKHDVIEWLCCCAMIIYQEFHRCQTIADVKQSLVLYTCIALVNSTKRTSFNNGLYTTSFANVYTQYTQGSIAMTFFREHLLEKLCVIQWYLMYFYLENVNKIQGWCGLLKSTILVVVYEPISYMGLSSPFTVFGREMAPGVICNIEQHGWIQYCPIAHCELLGAILSSEGGPVPSENNYQFSVPRKNKFLFPTPVKNL